MKKKLVIAVIAVLFIVIISLMLIIFHRDKNSITVVLYYLNSSETSLIAEKENIPFDDPAQIPINIIERLQSKKGSKNSPVSSDCTVNSVTFEQEKSITIDFSQEFLSQDSHKNVLKVYAIVKSICSTSSVLGITEVKITVEGEPVTTADGKELGFLSDSSINIMNSAETMTLRCYLYFKGENGVLKAETREIDAANGTIEYNIVTELISGPKTKGLSGVFPSGTELISAQTIDGICYVNFANLPKSSDTDTLRAALVYTLSNLDGIEQVQILINGKNSNIN